MVNVNAADPAGNGTSPIVDPEGTVRRQAGPGEEILVDTLDLDAVDRVGALGGNGLNRPWTQLAAHGPAVPLPAYGNAAFPPPAWAGGPAS
ncbi:hypothetical protein [Streptomyces sp. NPDC086023]|uniref:hypothetical protein n=1 Tax=Streptomyces sp. NPDC086023 TaxID=3365746 RepID=UPI0037D14A94